MDGRRTVSFSSEDAKVITYVPDLQEGLEMRPIEQRRWIGRDDVADDLGTVKTATLSFPSSRLWLRRLNQRILPNS